MKKIFFHNRILIISVIVVLGLNICLASIVNNRTTYRLGYVNFSKILRECGYNEINDTTWAQEKDGILITIAIDVEKKLCMKNNYFFKLDTPVNLRNNIYITKNDCENILNVTVARKITGGYKISNKEYNEWADTVVVSHAGGAVRKDLNVYFYTNSQEALVQNYSLGSRVFEFDFYSTSDDNLAVVHDWDDFGNLDGTVFSTEKWLDFKTGGMGEANGQFTTMDVGILFDQMVVNPDMFVIVDTKSYFYPDKGRSEYEIIRDEAIKRDEELLNRIIPQVYNFEMYDYLKNIYDFKDMIFTCYGTDASSDEIIKFCSEHEEFKAITAPYGDERFDFAAVKKIKENNMKLFYHTIYDYESLVGAYQNGADGVYTGIYTPKDVKEIMNFSY